MIKNVAYLKKVFSKLVAVIISALSILLSVITFIFPNLTENWECCIIGKVFILVLCFAGLFLIIFFISLIATKLKRKNTIWQKGCRSVTIVYDDIFKLKSKKKDSKKKYIVISVDTQFMTQVDEDTFKVKNPCVSINTLHGKFIKQFYETESKVAALDSEISEYISLKGYQPDSAQMEKYQNSSKNRYEIGTVVEVQPTNDSHFLLLAVSEFDENNNAHSSKEFLVKSLVSLLEFYNKNCQGNDLYIPLIGTSLSRIELSDEQSLQIIRATIEQNLNYVHGNVNIVVYEKNRSSVSIF